MKATSASPILCNKATSPRLATHMSATSLGIRQVLHHAPVKIRGETYAIPWPQPSRGDALHRGGACRPAGGGESHQRQCDNARRSEERRVGKECVSTCKSGWAAEH